jgi:2'-5' RNA ligase
MSVRRVAVIFPHADTGDVELFRQRWDPLANSVAAHITVVFPFVWHSSIGALETFLGDAVLKHPRFPVRLNGFAIWEDEYLFLLAREGADQISRLHHDLYAGLLPGLAAPRVFVPHMTVGRRRHPDELLTALGEANGVQLSLDGFALALSIYRIEQGGRRVRELDVPLPSTE